jgi:3-isopropylmalate/(R)-2-methylmalate dehydratase small subunit
VKISGRVWKYGDNINTDGIFPGKYTYTIMTPEEMAQHAMENFDPEFVNKVKQGDILVAGSNFGCGSSREQAVVCLKASGISALIGKSFARIYYRNAINNGLLPVQCPEAVDTISEGDEITIDTEGGVIQTPAGSFTFPPLAPFVQEILDSGGLIPYTRKKLGIAAG